MRASRARYGVVALAIGLAVLSYMQRVAISEAAGPISHELHIPKQQMGLIFGAFGLSYALFEIPMGLLGDRVGVRRVLLQIVLAWSAFTALTGAAWNVVSLYVIRFLFGAGEAGCFPNLTRMLGGWLPARERVTAQALMWAFTRWGGAATPPLSLLFITLVGWRWAFVGFAGLGVVWCIVFLIWFRDDPQKHPSVNAAELELLQTSRALTSHTPGEAHWLSLLLTPQIAALVLQYFCFSYVWYFYITWLPTYLREARGQSPERAAALAVLPLLFGGFGSLATGLAPRRLPRRAVAFFGFLGTAILLFAFMHIHSVVPAMVAMGIASFCSDLTMPISWDACFQIGGSYTATVAAAMNMLGNLAGFIAPVVGGVILQRTGGDWNLLIDTMVGAAMVSSLCWLYLNPESAQRQRKQGAEHPGTNRRGEPVALIAHRAAAGHAGTNRRETMKVDLTGRVAVITGGSRGLGEAMAKALSEAGAHIALVARDKKQLDRVRDAITERGGTAAVFTADVTSEADVASLAEAVKQQFGAPQILINNAGSNLRKNLIDFTLNEFRSVIDTSLISTFLLCRAFVPGMKGSGYGRILNMTSIMSHVSLPGRTAYSSAKTALLGLTRALALELAGEGITVNGISPGPFGTEMNAAVMNNPEANAQFLASLPVGRWGKIEEIGALACYLCSEAAGFITGTDILIDGGWTAK